MTQLEGKKHNTAINHSKSDKDDVVLDESARSLRAQQSEFEQKNGSALSPEIKKNRYFLYFSFGFFSFIILLILVLLIVLKIGISGAYFTSQIQAALSKQLGNVATATLSNTRLSLDNDFHIAFEAKNVMLQDIKGGVELDRIGQINIGISTLSLLSGKLEIKKIELNNSNIILPKSNGSNFLNRMPQDEFGRVDPDAIANQIFPSFDSVDKLLKLVSVDVIVFNDISIRMPADGSQPLYIKNLTLSSDKTTTNLISNLQWGDREIQLSGKADYVDKIARNLELKLDNMPLHLGAADDVSPYLDNGRTNSGHFKLKGDTDITLTAKRDSIASSPQIHMQIVMPTGLLDLGTEQNIPTEFAIHLEHLPQSKKIEVTPSKLIMGGVDLTFDGALGLVPATNDNQKPENDYRFELLSNQAVSASAEIPEAALKFSTKIAGQFKLSDKKAFIDELVVNTPHGNIIGQGSLRFGVGTPETIFVLHSVQLDVAEAKQLWPVNIATGARKWVGTHIYGGSLKNSVLEIALPLGYFRSGIPAEPLTEKEIKISTDIINTRSDLIGELPALRDISGKVVINGTTTNITFDKGIGYLPNQRQINVSDGAVLIPWSLERPIYAKMHFVAMGDIASVGEVIGYNPINAKNKLPFDTEKAKGNVTANIDIKFPITKDKPEGEITYNAKVDFSNVSLLETGNNINVQDASGTAEISKQSVKVIAKGLMNDLPTAIEIVQGFNQSNVDNSETIIVTLDDTVREKYFSFLNDFLKGTITVEIGENIAGKRHIKADLSSSILEIPWIGWKKGKSIAAKAEFDVPADLIKSTEFTIENFSLTGANLELIGNITIKDKQLLNANFSKVRVNKNDQLALNITNSENTYSVDIQGQSFDARALILQLGKASSASNSNNALNLTANIQNILGFYNENLRNFTMHYRSAANNSQLSLKANTNKNIAINAKISNENGQQSIVVNTADTGSLLRFANYYDKMEGGTLKVELQAKSGNPLLGPVSIRDFTLVDEEKLAKLVSSKSTNGGKSLNDAVKGKINSTRVKFDLAYAQIAKGDNYLVLDFGVLRGPIVGATFQGVAFDALGNMSITGTFMPAYGLNRIFGDLPVIGEILGNGRDGGLLGITFKIEGNAKQPQVIINPISVIAPGIFRSIFEFQ